MTKDEYHKIDYRIMELAFAIHNKYGRFQDESVYRDELAFQIRKIGHSAETEVPLNIEYDSFKKRYFIDILVNESIVYELKVLDTINDSCRSQALNYQFISNNPFGKIINFGGESVQHEFSTTTLTLDHRKSFKTTDSDFSAISDYSDQFKQCILQLLNSWGTHLQLELYREAITHLCGGEENVVKRINIRSGNRVIGSKKVHLISHTEAFKITGLKNPDTTQMHMSRFLKHADLDAIQWINIHKNNIQFRTLKK
jgi:GxxExxY protein